MSPSAQHLLLADIGGTNVRFAWADTPTSEIQDVHQYACADFPTLAEAIDHYASKCRVQRFESAALGIATAVAGDRVGMTNHHWSFSQAGLRSRFAWKRLVVLNDFTALALSLPTLRDEDRMQLGEGRVAQPDQPIALLGAGTGLGMSGLLPYARQRWVPISGEGGHATLSPNSDLECEIVQILRREFGHVSAERALSGPGLVNLYRAACAMNRLPTEALTPADVLSKGQTGMNEACVTAVDLFCSFLAGSAGNLALSLGAHGGVYIGGGIAPRLLDRLQRPNFREAFERKGRFGEYLRDIPVWVITTPESPALRGAALALMAPHE
jgi:glucokinase